MFNCLVNIIKWSGRPSDCQLGVGQGISDNKTGTNVFPNTTSGGWLLLHGSASARRLGGEGRGEAMWRDW